MERTIEYAAAILHTDAVSEAESIASEKCLDLSGFDVSNVESYTDFAEGSPINVEGLFDAA